MINFKYLAVALLVFSCTSKKTPDSKIEQFLGDVSGDQTTPDNVTFVVIPTSGCTGCISSGISFLKKKIDDPAYQFVVTEISDKKYVKQTLGHDIFNNKRLVLDFDNKWKKYDLATTYPLVIVVKDGKASLITYMDPQNKHLWSKL